MSSFVYKWTLGRLDLVYLLELPVIHCENSLREKLWEWLKCLCRPILVVCDYSDLLNFDLLLWSCICHSRIGSECFQNALLKRVNNQRIAIWSSGTLEINCGVIMWSRFSVTPEQYHWLRNLGVTPSTECDFVM